MCVASWLSGYDGGFIPVEIVDEEAEYSSCDLTVGDRLGSTNVVTRIIQPGSTRYSFKFGSHAGNQINKVGIHTCDHIIYIEHLKKLKIHLKTINIII